MMVKCYTLIKQDKEQVDHEQKSAATNKTAKTHLLWSPKKSGVPQDTNEKKKNKITSCIYKSILINGILLRNHHRLLEYPWF